MISIPIPDKQSPIRYKDITWGERNMGAIVSDLTKGRVSPDYRAHLDPDLVMSSLPRASNWRPIFGQTGAAQGHLRNSGVAIGDLFLFFGLFREAEEGCGRISWKRDSPRLHVIWGWLQVGAMIRIDDCDAAFLPWARYHPHFHRHAEASNTLYLSRDNLSLPCIGNQNLPGSGVFQKFSPALRLTAPAATSMCDWDLPGWFYPSSGRTPLTYHNDPSRWRKSGQRTILQSVARGQEFVLDCNEYPEAPAWIMGLLKHHQ
jgi:hypothetical protein